MKTWMKDLLAAFFMGMVLPGWILNLTLALWNREVEISSIRVTIPPQTEAVEEQIPVLVRKETGAIISMGMEDYLVGVVLAEMPASFETEALKAQAVAARTYTRKADITGGKHGDGSVCTDPACCQAYLTEENYLAKGGTEDGLEKIRSAVKDTSGDVLVYQGELIEATYFSCSGGSTEDAAAVWGAEFPYLKAVESPGEEHAAYDRDQVHFTPDQFQDALGRELEGYPGQWFGQVAYTDGGGVETIQIGGEIYTGTQLRTLLNLRSTAFSIYTGENGITITTRGYGHRVGMSQYGADAMAAGGKAYGEILSHYYPGTELVRMMN